MKDAIDFLWNLRQSQLQSKPGIDELIKWMTTMIGCGLDPKKPLREQNVPEISVLVKRRQELIKASHRTFPAMVESDKPIGKVCLSVLIKNTSDQEEVHNLWDNWRMVNKL